MSKRRSQRRMRVGDQVIVTETHRDQHRNRLVKGQHGVVTEVAGEPGDPYLSYEVRWGEKPHDRVPRTGGKRTWVWTRHDPPVALRRAARKR